MANYHRVSPRFWSDTSDWTEDSRLLALYLLTCPHRVTEGMFRLPKSYVAADLDWPARRIAKAFDELAARGFLSYDDRFEVVLLRRALKYQPPAGPKQVKGAVNALETLPPSPLFAELMVLAEEFAPEFAKALAEHFGDVIRKHLRDHLPDTPSDAPSDSSSSNSSSSSSSSSSSDITPVARTHDEGPVTLERRLHQHLARTATYDECAELVAGLRAAGVGDVLIDEAVGQAVRAQAGSLEWVRKAALSLLESRTGARA